MAKKDPVAGLPEGHLTLEQARQVINAHHEAEREMERAKLLPLVGKYFKYWNNYGSGSPGWWLYGHVTGVDNVGMCTGWTFQRDENGKVEVEPNGRSTITIRAEGSGWREIPASEFWRAAASVSLSVVKQLARPDKKTQIRRRGSTQKASEK